VVEVAAVVYIESTKKLDDIIEKLRAANVSIGLGILPHTPLADVYACLEKNPAIYRPKTSDISPKNQRYIEGGGVFVQHMGSDDIGYHGVELDPVVYDRVREIRAKYPEIPIAVDIGVNEETAPKLVEAGVTKLVSGSTIFGSENIADTVEYLKNL
jgi:pentose-5-phosphate-3-epimerase